MDIEAQQVESASALAEGIAHLTAAAAQLERTAAALEARFATGTLGGEVAKVVAAIESTVDSGIESGVQADPLVRLAELEVKLQAAEARIAELRANSGSAPAVAASSGRKTLPAAAAHLLAKHGIDTLDQVNGGALDAALTGLSLEQRIAVKSQLLRAGLLS